MRVRQLNHSVYQTEYHLVWGTLYRRKFLKHYVREELIKKLYKIQKQYPDWYFTEINTGDDHVHILMEIPPKYSIAEVVSKLKSQTSVYLRGKFKFISKIYDGKDRIWGTGYFVSTVGLNEKNIRRYIERQNIFDRGFDLTDGLP
jgi:putative transposase